MHQPFSLVKPPKLHPGDKIATISLSWGGPGTYPHRYEAGKRQLEDSFGVKVVETKHALKSPEWIHENPRARAEDLMDAFAAPTWILAILTPCLCYPMELKRRSIAMVTLFRLLKMRLLIRPLALNQKESVMRNSCLRIALLVLLVAPLAGCATMKTTGQVVATPLTVVRDVVDVPLAGVANLSENFARYTKPAKAPHVNVGWSLFGGFNTGIGYDVSHFFFKGVSWIFGGVDYVICRSVWPNYPQGVNPWKDASATWGSLFFPNTKALWPSEDSTQADEIAV